MYLFQVLEISEIARCCVAILMRSSCLGLIKGAYLPGPIVAPCNGAAPFAGTAIAAPMPGRNKVPAASLRPEIR